MYSIKGSFANCSICDLLDAPSCILETNSKDDLSKIDIVFVSENPGKEEVEKGIPLIGKAGKTFRKFFDPYIKNNFKWLLTNCVLCLTLEENGTTGNPEDHVIDECKKNCFEIIRAANPKLIVLMGTSPMKAFGIAKAGITNIRGQMFKWENYDVLVTVHPSFVNRNQSFMIHFEEDIKKAAKILGADISMDSTIKSSGKKGIFRYTIPEKFYTDEYRLIDIQFLSKSNQVLYIFRDKNNNKVYHKESDRYVCYTCNSDVEARKIVPYDNLEQVIIPYKLKATLDHNITYEGDMKLTAKHAMDYYHFNKEEAPRILNNIMFIDIEVDPGLNVTEFPNPKEAKYPINMITAIYNSSVICYILDNKTEPITEKEGAELKIFDNETKLMRTFITDFKKVDPDFLAGWNSIAFDIEYIFNRLPKLNIPQGDMSKFGEFYVDSFRFVCNIPGCVPLDQLHLYKMFTFTKEENYKLGYIAQKVLKITKIDLEFPINIMYYKRLNKLIEYNIRDSVLLEKLENELNHIHLLNEIRTICRTCFAAGSSTFGQVDTIMVSFLNSKGLASKNSNPHSEKEKYPGAYVHPPVPGIYNTITDFDFTSLYPSNIMTYNIGVNNFIAKTIDQTIGYDILYNPGNLPEKIGLILDPLFSEKLIQISKEDLFNMIDKENLVLTINGCFFKSHEIVKSVYSEVLEELLSSRKTYKKKMLEAKEAKDKAKKDFFNTRQLVYKVLANSLYGVIANRAFRFYDNSCAAAITLSGQEALKFSIVEGDEYMKHLHLGKPVKRAPIITKQEMYSDEMPDRKPKYIIAGDTDSIFCCFEKFAKNKSDTEIKEYCDKIQSYLNTEIIGEIGKLHRVKPEFNKLELKNEMIISRGIFLAKKRYAIHVVNNEGKKVDDINFMGLEIKRSDYPSKSKEFLTELIDLILKSKTVSVPALYKFIQMKEREFISLIKNGDKSIARPVSYTKKMADYKTIPQGVRAMNAYNLISYNAHSPGSRSYMFRVSGVDETKATPEILKKYEQYVADHGKLEVVAIPDEDAKLPDFFIPDVKGNLQFSFIDRYELLLKPLTEVKKDSELMMI